MYILKYNSLNPKDQVPKKTKNHPANRPEATWINFSPSSRPDVAEKSISVMDGFRC